MRGCSGEPTKSHYRQDVVRSYSNTFVPHLSKISSCNVGTWGHGYLPPNPFKIPPCLPRSVRCGELGGARRAGALSGTSAKQTFHHRKKGLSRWKATAGGTLCCRFMFGVVIFRDNARVGDRTQVLLGEHRCLMIRFGLATRGY